VSDSKLNGVVSRRVFGNVILPSFCLDLSNNHQYVLDEQSGGIEEHMEELSVIKLLSSSAIR
jgi:hypothetical protein